MTKFVDPVLYPCNDCPFRRKSMAGWLGAGSPESFIDCMQRDEPLPCHQTIDYEDEHWLAKWMLQRTTGKMCAGSLIFMANKLQMHPFKKLEKDPELVFSNTFEFVRHHRGSTVQSWNDDDQNEGAQFQRQLIADSAKRMGDPIIDGKEAKAKKNKRSKAR